MEPTWIALWVFATVTLAVMAVALWLRELFWRRSPAGKDIPAGALPRLELPSPEPQSRGLQRVVDRLARLGYEAGCFLPEDGTFLTMLLCGTVLGGAMVLWLDSPLAGLGGFVLGAFVFWAWLSWKRARRMSRLQEQLPEVMELLARTVKAGLSVDQAIALVGRTVRGPLGEEFRRCAAQMEMGLSLPAAVQGLVQRVDLFEMRIFATALTVQRQTGGNLVRTLERLARMIRDRIAGKRQHQATTAAGRASTWVVAVAGPAVLAYLAIFQQDYLQRFVGSQLGKLLLGIALMLQLIGLLWIVRIMKNKSL